MYDAGVGYGHSRDCMEFVLFANVDDAMVNDETVQFFVPGVPKPKGSMRAFKRAGTNRIILINDNKGTKPWQAAISIVAMEHIKVPFSQPIFVDLRFIMPRPKKQKYTLPGVKPDLDKLVRCVFDALSNKIAFIDDALICSTHPTKEYGEKTGVYISLGLMPEADETNG